MFDWAKWKEEVIELNNHPVKHIPKFGGMGIMLCGILSYTYGTLVDKPLCEECAAAKKRGEK